LDLPFLATANAAMAQAGGGGNGGGGGSGAMPPPITGSSSNSLEALMAKRAQLDEDLRGTEKQLYEQEEQYLEETNHYGNVVRGWDGFLTSRPRPPSSTHASTHSKRTGITAKERVFSLSSTTAPVEGNVGGGGGLLGLGLGLGMGLGMGLDGDGLGGLGSFGDDVDGGGVALNFRGDGLANIGSRRGGNKASKMDDGDTSD
jgi:chromatin modification-related protein EAF6